MGAKTPADTARRRKTAAPGPTVLLCVGSGMAPRYRLNTLQALALPAGTHIQFRYDRLILAEEQILEFETRKYLGKDVVLGYVDCTIEGRKMNGDVCQVIPYRRAKLVTSDRLGSFFTLTFRLGDYAYAQDLKAFQNRLRPTTPHWIEGEKRPVGHWCQRVDLGAKGVDTVGSSSDFAHWQAITAQLARRADFENQPYFYKIEGLFRPRWRSRRVKPERNGEYKLRSNNVYELRLAHYDPNADAHAKAENAATEIPAENAPAVSLGGTAGAAVPGPRTEWLQIDVSAPLLAMRTSPRLAIDSPYDLKSAYFSTGDAKLNDYASLWLHPDMKADQPQVVPDLFFGISMKTGVWKPIWQGFVIGLSVSGMQLISAFAKGGVEYPRLVAGAIILLGFCTGFFVSFSLRKPL